MSGIRNSDHYTPVEYPQYMDDADVEYARRRKEGDAKRRRICDAIEKLTGQQLMVDERESITTILEYHEVEPSAAAERISTSLNETGVFKVTHEQIFDLL